MFKNLFGSKDAKKTQPAPAVQSVRTSERPAAQARPTQAARSLPVAHPSARPQQQRTPPMQDAAPTALVKKVEPSRNRELTDEQKFRLVQRDWTLLTAPGGVAEITASQAQYVALLKIESESPDKRPTNVLVVAKDYVAHPDTSTVLNKVRRKGITIHSEALVDMSTIHAIYEKASIQNPDSSFPNLSRGADAAEKQADFVRLLEIAAKTGASDIHIIVDRHTAIIRIRTDGVVMKLKEMPAGAALELCNAVFNMTETSEATYKPLDFQQARVTEGSLKGLKFPPGVQAVRLQFNPYASGHGRFLVARLLYAQKIGSNADIDELGYAPNQITDIRKMRRKTIGINIICGPTGSGKSTTLQRSLTAMMRERPGINGITIEDPPEYIIEGWVQLSIASAITAEERTKNFGLAMNAVLRDDPDAIMIGEIRDLISANLAYGAAETGHTVWASLHANSAIGILDRLRDLGLDLFKLGDATKFTGLVSQRLVRKIHPDHKCGWEEARQNKLVSDDLFRIIERLAGDRVKDIRFAATHRVDNPNEAYKGRSVAAETIIPDQKFLDFYIAGKKSDALAYWKDKLSGMDMLEHGFAMILMGVADVRAVEDVVGLLEDIDPARVPKILELVGL
ncbi:Flp pilus assembly complex ATPase component TadA [Rhizobium laguerreae]|uniref:ATPase, T2SS/T4P/T4SS family n=1 Tax=Rhizobium laguerreae TaxID=1076926 RepID=UPI001C90308C|nr:ATPase, T2SS/T4P/T4SS family [Rhizobium laguerreae]MBY3151265.1 Flp pilus assembly complex ATPase component TadA [Rhizobium laguerreae]